MREIQNVSLERSRNAAHYELVHAILDFAEQCQAVTQNMAAQLAALRASVEEEGRILGISLKSEVTQLVTTNDRERDWIVTGMKAIYSGLQYDADPAIAEAARVVLTQIESLKVNTNSNYLQETGEIDILLSALTGDYAEQVTVCKLEVLVQYLKAANDRMHELLDERDLMQADRTGTAMADARRATDVDFRAFIKFYNAWILVNQAALREDDLGTTLFSSETNTKIDYFKRYVLKQPGSSSMPEDGDEDEETTPENPTPENPTPENPPTPPTEDNEEDLDTDDDYGFDEDL